MGDLLRPGAGRGDGLVDDAALLAALLAVEQAWLDALVGVGIAPTSAATEVAALVSAADLPVLAEQSETTGNAVVPLVALLRSRAADPAATWLHRGLTSQDVLDTALMLLARSALDAVLDAVATQLDLLVALAVEHRACVTVARTLTQYAVPTTFGLTAATWLSGVLDAADDLLAARRALSVQCGGAAGTRAASVELARLVGVGSPEHTAGLLADRFADLLGLARAQPWHTSRRPVTRLGDALVAATDAWGRVANDVLLLARPEIGELSLRSGTGGSSTMPHKQNPVLPILVRRAALSAPQLGAQLHLAAASALDQRPDGAWHLEWPALRTLLADTVVAGSQTVDVLGALVVHADRMGERVGAATDQVLAERDGIRSAVAADPSAIDAAGATGRGPGGYLGTVDAIITATCERAATTRKELA